MCKNIVESNGAHGNVVRRMRFACWVTNATDTHTLRICNKCLSTAKMVARTRLDLICVRPLAIFYDYKL